MADLKISALTPLATLQDADLFVVVDDSEVLAVKNKSLTWAALKAMISAELGSNFALADLSNTNLGDESAGDLLYYTGSAWDNLPKGTPGYFLKSTAGGLEWAEVVGGGGGISHATADGNYYASKDGDWADVADGFLPLTLSEDKTVTFGGGEMYFDPTLYGGYYFFQIEDASSRSFMEMYPGYFQWATRDLTDINAPDVGIYSFPDPATVEIFGTAATYGADYTSAMTTDRHIPDIGKVRSMTGDSKRVQATVTDGDTPELDCDSGTEVYFTWEGSNSTPDVNIVNSIVNSVFQISYRKVTAGNVTIKLAGDDLKFVLEGNATPAATLDIVLSGAENSYWSINGAVTGHTNGYDTDKVVTVTYKQ